MSEQARGRERRKYSAEFKRTAVDRMAAGESATLLAQELDIRAKFLYAWRADGKGSAGRPVRAEKPAETDPREREIARLKAKLAEVERLNGQQAAELDFFVAAFRSSKAARPNGVAATGKGSPSDPRPDASVKRHQGAESGQRVCELAQVSRAGFNRDWQQRQPREAEVAIRDAIQKATLDHRQYGYRRVTRIVQRSGIAVGEGVVRRILKTDNLLAIGRRKFKATSDSAHGFTVYTNLVQYLQIKAINQLWVADITYLRLQREFVYLAVVLDVFLRRVVGWALRRNLQTSLSLAALEQALEKRKPEPGLVHHSDRGAQYASNDYVRRLEDAGMVISMSRLSRPGENADCESFMSTLKREQIACTSYTTLEDPQKHMEDFIDTHYNVERLHSALAYCSPAELEQHQRQSPPLGMSFSKASGNLS